MSDIQTRYYIVFDELHKTPRINVVNVTNQQLEQGIQLPNLYIEPFMLHPTIQDAEQTLAVIKREISRVA